MPQNALISSQSTGTGVKKRAHRASYEWSTSGPLHVHTGPHAPPLTTARENSVYRSVSIFTFASRPCCSCAQVANTQNVKALSACHQPHSVNRAAANGMSQRSARVQPAARAAYEHVRSAHAGTRTGQFVTERKQASARSGSTISSDAIKLGRGYVHAARFTTGKVTTPAK